MLKILEGIFNMKKLIVSKQGIIYRLMILKNNLNNKDNNIKVSHNFNKKKKIQELKFKYRIRKKV